MPAHRQVRISTESWQFKSPLRITGYTFSTLHLLYVAIHENGSTGSGEATGVYYLGETGDSMLAQAESVKNLLGQGAGRHEIRSVLPAGGARNAIDCALWDLEAKLAGQSIWQLTGVNPLPTECLLTIGIDSPERMANRALSLDSNKIKVKLDADLPFERISAVRNARPDAEILVDVNQGWTFEQLTELAPKFKDLEIAMIKQPLPRGADEELEAYVSPITLCADESCLDSSEFEQAAQRYQMINIKLDKTGGLTEALELAGLALGRGLELMVGNMGGTSLGMAPGFVVAQMCRFVDLDGAVFLTRDRANPMIYHGGMVSPPSAELWG